MPATCCDLIFLNPVLTEEKVQHLLVLDFLWWGRTDSNHRSDTQQIYSLSPLATRELPHILFTSVETEHAYYIMVFEKVKHFFRFFKKMRKKMRLQICSRMYKQDNYFWASLVTITV